MAIMVKITSSNYGLEYKLEVFKIATLPPQKIGEGVAKTSAQRERVDQMTWRYKMTMCHGATFLHKNLK